MPPTATDIAVIADCRAVNDAPAGPAATLTISTRFLLCIYAILPLCLVAMFVDMLFLNGVIIRNLPTSPEAYFLFQLAFGTPHILASTLILVANVDYLRAFGLGIFVYSLLLLAFFGIGMFFIPFEGFLAIVGSATVLHVIKQQVGIGKAMCRLSNWLYEIWGWTLIVLGSILYFLVYAGLGQFPSVLYWMHVVLWALSAVAIVLTIMCHRRITTPLGRMYLWANTVMVLQSMLFYGHGYAFLAILGPRLVHDITAFTFYITHDVNRHGSNSPNLVYRVAGKLGIGVFWIIPVLAVLLTYLLGRYDGYLNDLAKKVGYDLAYGATFIVVGYLGLLHYYTEAFTWRRDSPYRRYFSFSA